jgi:hypothetical protein
MQIRNKIIRVQFKWYDMWIGLFYDRKSKTTYICPFPTLVISISGGS